MHYADQKILLLPSGEQKEKPAPKGDGLKEIDAIFERYRFAIMVSYRPKFACSIQCSISDFKSGSRDSGKDTRLHIVALSVRPFASWASPLFAGGSGLLFNAVSSYFNVSVGT